MKRFAIMGVAGFVARRHLEAIHRSGGQVVAAYDPQDSVGILDQHFPHARFFADGATFAAYLRTHRDQLDYVCVLTPNHLHEAHCTLALQAGVDVICEKPLVIDSAGVDRLAAVAARTGRTIHPILQVRLHEAMLRMREDIQQRIGQGEYVRVATSYVTRRGPWYHVSWKSDPLRSGGILFNLGIHLFDILAWTFGELPAEPDAVEVDGPYADRASGVLRFARGEVRWLISAREDDLPATVRAAGGYAHRVFEIGGRTVADYSGDYSHLHHCFYRELGTGRGARLADSRPGIALIERILASSPGNRQRALWPGGSEANAWAQRVNP
ncbi:Gfo/Idh/MocA family protein [Kitasatospora viridis]|uniref:UDP-N-acetyl-2-amino-2-deoxyglucuronate dehydrogenase n=1 Tax=Kitasatospora viridis TaxID=281105 RepID=A0A561T690_9ACTN|nr:Gfo/Idh/MocA family oxidoreductase [Kitasatospora viridis]TWF82630.1 UDP-N-acetyl-2-amino-2-deoxyglucuronate dehydrogenase [Kitasatospora viridis]